MVKYVANVDVNEGHPREEKHAEYHREHEHRFLLVARTFARSVAPRGASPVPRYEATDHAKQPRVDPDHGQAGEEDEAEDGHDHVRLVILGARIGVPSERQRGNHQRQDPAQGYDGRHLGGVHGHPVAERPRQRHVPFVRHRADVEDGRQEQERDNVAADRGRHQRNVLVNVYGNKRGGHE